MLFREIIDVNFEDHTKPKYTLWAKYSKLILMMNIIMSMG
jgi:hypothetical protein